MNRLKMFALCGALLVATSLAACVSAPPNATPDQKSAATQTNFDSACKFASATVPTAKKFLPLITTKIGEAGGLAVGSFLTLVQTTCSAPLDITNAAAITQRLYDAGGEVLALVVKAQGGGS